MALTKVSIYFGPGILLRLQRLEAGDNVKQFLVDAALPQAMEFAVKILKQVINIFVGAFHGSQAARIFAGEGFGAGPKERDEQIFANERAQGRGIAAYDFGKVFGWPADFDHALLPLGVEWQQALADRFVERTRLRTVMEDIKTGVIAPGAMRFAFDLDLPDERCDGFPEE